MKKIVFGFGLFTALLIFASAPVSKAFAMKDTAAESNAFIIGEFYSASYALVIGIDDYQKGWPRLSNAVRDAREVATALEVTGYEVSLLTNPDRASLIQAMREFFIVKGNDPDARLFMWFAGHGHTENGEGFIIPADGDEPESGPGFRLSAIPMRDFSTYVRLAQSKHVFSVFDSCFAGTVFDTRRAAPPKALTEATTKPVRQFLTSGDAYQQVSDDGTFREIFIRLLTGDESGDLNDDGFLTATELGFYISDRMTNLTEGQQTPRYGKLRDRDFDLGDYVLAAYGSAQQNYPPQTQTATFDERALEMTFWNSIQASENASVFRAYLDKYGDDGEFTELAKIHLERLERSSPATPEPQLNVAALLPKSNAPIAILPEKTSEQVEAELKLSSAQRRRVQRALTMLGFDTRGVDGAFGRNSRQAITSFQVANSVPGTGYLTERQYSEILSQASIKLEEWDAAQEKLRIQRRNAAVDKEVNKPSVANKVALLPRAEAPTADTEVNKPSVANKVALLPRAEAPIADLDGRWTAKDGAWMATLQISGERYALAVTCRYQRYNGKVMRGNGSINKQGQLSNLIIAGGAFVPFGGSIGNQRGPRWIGGSLSLLSMSGGDRRGVSCPGSSAKFSFRRDN